MAYRTKIYKQLEDLLLKPIMNFNGLMFDTKSKEFFEQYRWVDCKYDENHKIQIQYLRNKYNDDKIYINISNYDEFINYRNHRDEFEYFNPFAKYKNTLYLLLLMVPTIYDRFCINKDMDSMTDDELDSELVDLVVNDEVSVTQEEILKHINVKQYPVIKGEFRPDGKPLYHYGIEITKDNGESHSIDSQATDKIIALWMLILMILDYLDETPDIVLDHNGDFRNVQLTLTELFEKYNKERELNRKDMKKVKHESNEVEDFIEDTKTLEDAIGFDDDVDLSSEEETKREISITDTYKTYIPIGDSKEEDDSLLQDIEFL